MKLKLNQIQLSKTNPRKNFDEQLLKGLAESIKTKGQQFPILVREIGGTPPYQLVDGERRLKAAKIAGLTEIEAIVRTMTDEDAVEAQLISFVQTEGITPLEEAEAFEKYATGRKEITNKEIGLKFGKSAQYVAGRRQLSKLIPHFKEVLGKENLSLVAALEICKLSADQQKEFIEELADDWQFQSDKDIIDYIKEHYFLDLSSAPFKKDDATLVPKAGACLVCPKQTGASPDLFGGTKKSFCRDADCFQEKIEAHIERKLKEYEDEGKKLVKISSEWSTKNNVLGSKVYDKIDLKKAKVFGIFPEGSQAGHVIGITLKNIDEETVTTENREPSFASRMERYNRRMELHGNRIEQEVRNRLLPLVMKKIETLKSDDLKIITLYVVEELASEYSPDEIEKLINASKDHQLIRLCLEAILSKEEIIRDPQYVPDDERFKDLVKRYKVDRAGITKQVETEFKPKEPKKPVKEEPVKKPVKKAKKSKK